MPWLGLPEMDVVESALVESVRVEWVLVDLAGFGLAWLELAEPDLIFVEWARLRFALARCRYLGARNSQLGASPQFGVVMEMAGARRDA